MTVQPSCPALVVFEDGDFRRQLIKALDASHFAVTFASDGPDAVRALSEREFKVAIVGLSLSTQSGVNALDHLRLHRDRAECGVIVVGEPTPELRGYAPWVSETLMRPVDAAYVATRARAYCGC